MKVEVQLLAGPDGHEPTKYDVQKNIDALERVVKRMKKNDKDRIHIRDTISVLRGIQKDLPT
jgi:hypothetical protein